MSQILKPGVPPAAAVTESVKDDAVPAAVAALLGAVTRRLGTQQVSLSLSLSLSLALPHSLSLSLALSRSRSLSHSLSLSLILTPLIFPRRPAGGLETQQATPIGSVLPSNGQFPNNGHLFSFKTVSGGGQHASYPTPAFERRGDTLKCFKDVCLEGRAGIWPWLSYMCHTRSAALVTRVTRVSQECLGCLKCASPPRRTSGRSRGGGALRPARGYQGTWRRRGGRRCRPRSTPCWRCSALPRRTTPRIR